MEFFLQMVVNALQLGSFYALIALGYSMVYGVLLLFNFAHGDVFMVGAYIGFFIATGLHGEKPKSGIYIRGRVTSVGGGYRMKYGIEAYFMPKEKALKAERSVRQGANAEVYLLGSGKAAIAKLNCKSGDCQGLEMNN